MESEYSLELKWKRYRDLNYLSDEDKIEFKKLNDEMKRLEIGIFKLDDCSMEFKFDTYNIESVISNSKQINIFVGKENEIIKNLFDRIKKDIPNSFISMDLGNNIHYSEIYDRIYTIIKTLTKCNENLFVYTQSLEMIKHLPDIVYELGIMDDFKLTRIDRSKHKSNKDGLIIIDYNTEELKATIEMGFEMR